jgi:hypothetical protein
MTDNRYPLEITERCPVNPNTRMGEIPGDDFMRLWGTYSEWLDGAIEREIRSLKNTGRLTDNLDRYSVKPIVVNHPLSPFGPL